MDARKIIDLITRDKDKDRSPYSLSILEIAAAVAVSLVIWIDLNEGKLSPREIEVFLWPLIAVQFIAVVSLLRFVRNDVLAFSRISHLMLAWPLLTLPAFLLSDMTICNVYIMGFPAAIFSMLITRKMGAGEWVAVLVNGIWLFWLAMSFIATFD